MEDGLESLVRIRSLLLNGNVSYRLVFLLRRWSPRSVGEPHAALPPASAGAPSENRQGRCGRRLPGLNDFAARARSVSTRARGTALLAGMFTMGCATTWIPVERAGELARQAEHATELHPDATLCRVLPNRTAPITLKEHHEIAPDDRWDAFWRPC
jgi:hypothetical protein